MGDQSVLLVSIPGHSDGPFAVKITNAQGKFVLLVSDGGYAKRSWSEMITSGIALDRASQRRSLEWIRMVSEDANCAGVFATHDAGVKPCVVEI
ncbi:hypothetical protein [Campylobacter curvus]|uniref:hypothetical protein n=1 Tax=Campylobacter curvus TaxID=200 RepID=UPI001B8AFCB8|nr:hypothetical protein [Campylobacter curvus]